MPEKLVAWNALQADIQLSPSVFAVHNGTLSRDPDSVKFDFRARLDHRQFKDNRPIQAHLDTQNADARHSRSRRIHVSGDGIWICTASCGNARRSTAGNHSFARTEAIYGEPVETFSSNLNFNGEEAELKDIQADPLRIEGHRRCRFQSFQRGISFHADRHEF